MAVERPDSLSSWLGVSDERHKFPSAPFAQFLAFGVFDACSLVQQCG